MLQLFLHRPLGFPVYEMSKVFPSPCTGSLLLFMSWGCSFVPIISLNNSESDNCEKGIWSWALLNQHDFQHLSARTRQLSFRPLPAWMRQQCLLFFKARLLQRQQLFFFQQPPLSRLMRRPRSCSSPPNFLHTLHWRPSYCPYHPASIPLRQSFTLGAGLVILTTTDRV
jgi:hypothetical protein